MKLLIANLVVVPLVCIAVLYKELNGQQDALLGSIIIGGSIGAVIDLFVLGAYYVFFK